MRRRAVVGGSVAVAAAVALLLLRSCGDELESPEREPVSPTAAEPAPARERAERPTRPESPAPPDDTPRAEPPRPPGTPHDSPAGTLEVVVVTGGDRRPVAGAEVVVDRAFQRGTDTQRQRVDSEGRATFELKGGPHLVEVTAGATAPGGGVLSGGSRAVLGPGRCEIALRATRRLVVRVTVEGRAPEEAVKVTWRPAGDDPYASSVPGRSGSVPVDPAGRSEIDLEDGSYELSVSPASRGSPIAHSYVGVVDAAAGEVSVDLVRGAWLVVAGVDFEPGVVLPPNAGVQWRARPAAGSAARSHSHGTVPPGRFLSRNVVQPGRYDIEAQLIDRQTGRVTGWGTLAGISTGTEDVRLRIGPGGRVTGRVLDVHGAPIPAPPDVTGFLIYVTAYRIGEAARGLDFLQNATCDDAGNFVLEGLPPRPIDLDVRLKGWYLPERRRVEPGATGVELRLERAVSIRGRVVCAGWEGQLAGDVFVDDGPSASIRPDGSFDLRDLRPGPVRLRWRVNTVVLADLGEVVAPAEGVVLAVELP